MGPEEIFSPDAKLFWVDDNGKEHPFRRCDPLPSLVIVTSWEEIFDGRPARWVAMQKNLARFFKGARKARKHLLKERGYYA